MSLLNANPQKYVRKPSPEPVEVDEPVLEVEESANEPTNIYHAALEELEDYYANQEFLEAVIDRIDLLQYKLQIIKEAKKVEKALNKELNILLDTYSKLQKVMLPLELQVENTETPVQEFTLDPVTEGTVDYNKDNNLKDFM